MACACASMHTHGHTLCSWCTLACSPVFAHTVLRATILGTLCRYGCVAKLFFDTGKRKVENHSITKIIYNLELKSLKSEFASNFWFGQLHFHELELEFKVKFGSRFCSSNYSQLTVNHFGIARVSGFHHLFYITEN